MTQAEPTSGEGSDTAAIRLAQQIRQRRNAERLSQSDLAAMIGYTPQYVSLAERPRKGLPSASLVTAIDKALCAGGMLIELHWQAKVQRRALHPSGASEETPALSDASTGAGAHAARTALTLAGDVRSARLGIDLRLLALAVTMT